MSAIVLSQHEGIATVRLSLGKVNALNGDIVEGLRRALDKLQSDSGVRGAILTGEGRFFSFGFDIPSFLSFSRKEFAEYLTNFTSLYTSMFVFPKPLVAALNGHAIAGGCMLALACDRRVMVDGRAKISLNEITFGSSVFAGSVEMLRFAVGNRNAADVLYSGTMYSAREAEPIGLVDLVTPEDELLSEAQRLVRELAEKPGPAFASIKLLMREPVAEEMRRREARSISEFVDIWYSPSTWANLEKIEIR